ncbi:CapA family protein [Rhizobacter sp. LjRoot28]|uniref:CapA family protein n=1 Tax=Rhizobacter sp. LjRoot28 TaxID=3342309 RepID=UPI003ECFA2FE
MSRRLSFVGDLFLSGELDALEPAARDAFFDDLARAMNGSEVVFGNFEGVALAERPLLPPDKIRMPVDPAWLPVLRRAGFNVLSLSNNHVFDFGRAAFEASRDRLRGAGFQVFGAGADVAEAAAVSVVRLDDLRVGFIGVTCDSTHPARDAGGAVLSLQAPDLTARVAAARQGCDLLVVSVHWGDEHVAWPSPAQVRMARQLVEAGADVVAGHHAHVLQGCERYRHGVIAYGLGGITIAGLQQRVVWQGLEQAYRFVPEARHRRSAVLTVAVEAGKVNEVTLEHVRIADDGRPQLTGHRRMMSGGHALRLWHLPGYALFYRAVVFLQFWLRPRAKVLFSRRALHKLRRLAGRPGVDDSR